MKSTAAKLFHQPPQNLNCAQSVLAAYQEATGDTSTALEPFRAHGGGRAPEGICGAIYAACQLRPEAAEGMKADFQAHTGALGCRELKAKGISCKACVELAAELLEKNR